MTQRLISDVEALVRKTPTAIAVATLVDTHGIEAARDRWGWISPRTIFSLIRQGRRQLARRAADGSR